MTIPAILGNGEMKACFAPTKSIKPDVKSEHCLSVMIYGEARGEPEQGMRAVAYTALNRAAKSTICGVILAPKQYSIFNAHEFRAVALNVNSEPVQKNSIDRAAWYRALMVANQVIKREVIDPTNGSTHYISPIAMRAKGYIYPRWSKEYKHVTTINNHQFYRRS